MSLIHCPKCQRKISSKNIKCPYCGYQRANDYFFDWPLFYLTTVSVFMLVVIVFLSYFQGVFQGIFLVVMAILTLLTIVLPVNLLKNLLIKSMDMSDVN